MIDIHAQLKRLKAAGIVLTILSVLLLSACGSGDNGDESESIEETSLGTVEDVATIEADGPLVGSPSPVGDDLDGSPASEDSASPGVNVSSPPISLPTMTPTLVPVTATPTVDDSLADSASAEDGADAAVGDGTGGAVPIPGDAQPDTEQSVDASPVASPASTVTSVTSCTVASYPAYTGADVAQVTTVETALLTGPGADCELLGDPIPVGTQVEVLSDPVQREGDDQNTWLAVSLDGSEGWLASDNLSAPGAGQ